MSALQPERCGLSPALRRCFNVIEKHITETGCSPSYDQIMRELGLNSKGNVHRMVNDLQARGWITFKPNLKRSIALVETSTPTYTLPAEVELALLMHCRTCGTDAATVLAYARQAIPSRVGGKGRSMTTDLISPQPLMWTRVAKRLRSEVGDEQFSAWFTGLQCAGVLGDHLYLTVPTPFIKRWLQEHFAETIRNCCHLEDPTIEYIVIGVRTELRRIGPRPVMVVLPAPVVAPRPLPPPAPEAFGDLPRDILRAVVGYLSRAEQDGERESAAVKLLKFCAPARSASPIGEIAKIQRVVAEHYGISRMDLISHRRTSNIVQPRQVAMYLAKTLTPLSLPQIGRQFGKRDHTTVLHAVRKIALRIQTDELLARVVEILLQQLKPAEQEKDDETIGTARDHYHEGDHSCAQEPARP